MADAESRALVGELREELRAKEAALSAKDAELEALRRTIASLYDARKKQRQSESEGTGRPTTGPAL